MNPFLNPYMTQTNMNADTALLYFVAAQRQTGGIGSGVISGVRQAETGTIGARRAPPRNPGPYALDASANYFQRGQGRFGVNGSQYFQRTSPRPVR